MVLSPQSHRDGTTLPHLADAPDFLRMFLGEGKPNQTQLSEWSPAGLTEITDKTRTTTAAHVAYVAEFDARRARFESIKPLRSAPR
jgi:hypothetical protein